MNLGTRVASIALMVAAGTWSAPAFAGGDSWMTDFAAAQEKAKTERKDLLIDFTGSDWCGWCKRLDKEVFAAGDFDAKVQETFVLVKLDFPQDESLVTAEEKAQNKVLMARYGVQGFPTIFLTDAAGRPYEQIGYEAGGPENYLKELETRREKKQKFNDAMAGAADLHGMEKAKALDAALGTLEQSYILPFYEVEVAEILNLAGGDEGGLKAKYDGLRGEFEERQASAELNEAVGPYFQKQDWDGALKALDEFAAKYEANPSLAVHASLAKAQVLTQKDDSAGALKVLDDFAAKHKDHPKAAAQACLAKTNVLAQQENWDGALENLDTIIASFKDDSATVQQAWMSKVGIFIQKGNFDEAIASVDKARDAAPDSDVGKQHDMYVEKIKAMQAAAGGGKEDGGN